MDKERQDNNARLFIRRFNKGQIKLLIVNKNAVDDIRYKTDTRLSLGDQLVHRMLRGI